LFILPLLVAYEFGVFVVGGPQSLAIRNGADAWMRWFLASAGLGLGMIAPALVIIILFAWAIRNKSNPPGDLPALVLGIALESVGFALGLWALSRAFGPLLDSLGVDLALPGQASAESRSTPPLAQIVTYLGAGIYEEVIFRLVVFLGAIALLRSALVPNLVATVSATAISALSFAAVHHLGAHGESANGYVFVFRTLAGLLFTLLFLARGFGVTVGTHACYDVLVGISL
jgi:membrane protease YdiL (CAAX protease family)